MTDAIDNPVKRQYNKKEYSTEDMPVAQRPEVDLGDLVNFIRNESLVKIEGKPLTAEYTAELAFNEEPVVIRIEENSRSDHPETHVACAVNGTDAEVFQNGKWVRIGWLPVNMPLTVKRKYVEILARSNSESIRTIHDDATVAMPNNRVRRATSSNYPITVIRDDNPKGHEWLSRIKMGY